MNAKNVTFRWFPIADMTIFVQYQTDYIYRENHSELNNSLGPVFSVLLS